MTWRAVLSIAVACLSIGCGPTPPDPRTPNPAKPEVTATPRATATECPAAITDGQRDVDRAAALEGAVIAKVCFLGAKDDAAKLAEIVSAREGEKLSEAGVAKDILALHRTNRVDDVSVYAIAGDDKRAVLVFQVTPRPRVSAVAFEGVDEVLGRTVFSARAGEPWNPAAARGGCRALEDQLRLRGHMKATCSSQIDPKSLRAVVRVQKGAIFKVSKVSLPGAKAVKEAELLKVSGITVGDTFAPENIQRGVVMMSSLYYDRGMLMAKLALDVKEEGADGMAISLAIDEGPVFKIKGIKVTGELGALKEAELLKETTSKANTIFNRSQVLRDVEKMGAFAKARGATVEIVPDMSVDEKAHTVDVTLKVERR